MSNIAKTEVWIASHLTSDLQCTWLCEAIKSCGELSVVVSLSGSEEYISKFKELYVPKDSHKIHFRTKKYQFDHLSSICSESTLDDHDIVIFLDDDDLLLKHDKSSQDVNAYLGFQYIGIDAKNNVADFNKNATNGNINKYISESHSVLIKDYDFSGTTVKFGYIKYYFEHQREKYMSPLEDVHFMKCIESVPNFIVLSEPNIFRRIKGEPSS